MRDTPYFSSLKYFIINVFIKLFQPIILKFEKKYYSNSLNKKIKHQPIFIIGTPRSGSTILYQSLTNQLDVLYINNFICKKGKNLLFSFWLSKKLFKNKAHNSFKSKFGNTTEFGLNSPSECGTLWHRWLKNKSYYIDKLKYDQKIINKIRTEITTITNYYNKPFVFKNLGNSLRIELIRECFPNAKIIYIERETINTAQSILNARKKIKIKDNEFWSIIPPALYKTKISNVFELIIKQIYHLTKHIKKDLQLIPKENLLIINYNDLINIDNIIINYGKFGNIKAKEGCNKTQIKLSKKITISNTEFDNFKVEINKLNWK